MTFLFFLFFFFCKLSFSMINLDLCLYTLLIRESSSSVFEPSIIIQKTDFDTLSLYKRITVISKGSFNEFFRTSFSSVLFANFYRFFIKFCFWFFRTKAPRKDLLYWHRLNGGKLLRKKLTLGTGFIGTGPPEAGFDRDRLMQGRLWSRHAHTCLHV